MLPVIREMTNEAYKNCPTKVLSHFKCTYVKESTESSTIQQSLGKFEGINWKIIKPWIILSLVFILKFDNLPPIDESMVVYL